jgi:uncharacterized protein (DUF983 family)
MVRICPRCNGSMIYNRYTREWQCLSCGYSEGGFVSTSSDGMITNYFIVDPVPKGWKNISHRSNWWILTKG